MDENKQNGKIINKETPVTGETTKTNIPSEENKKSPGGQSKLRAWKTFLKKRFAIVGVAAVLLLGGSAGAYFGYIVPNKPENIWSSAMSNTADGYDKLVQLMEKKEPSKGYKLTGELKSEGALSVDGSIEGQSYGNNSQFNADIGMAGMRIDLEGKMISKDEKTTPDIYLKVGGISSISGLLYGTSYEGLIDLVNSVDGQWLYFDRTLLSEAGADSIMNVQSDRQDMIDVFKSISQVNRDYLFASDQDKAVFEIVENVGKEDKDGGNAYHYRVKANKENVVKYVEEIVNKISQSEAIDDPMKDQLKSSMDKFKKSMEDKSTGGSKTDIDLWVDLKTKLVRSVRFTNQEDKADYVEMNMPYDGGDEFPFNFVFNFSEDGTTNKATLKIVYNPSTDKISLNANMETSSGSGEEDIKLTANISAEPSDSKVEVTKPDDAISIMDVISGFIGGYGGLLEGLPVDGSEFELTL